MGVDHPGGPGKGPETAGKTTPQGTSDQSPADPPGANGKTPRMDSLTAAGWKFPGRPGTGDEQRGDREPQTFGDLSVEAKPDAKKDLETDKTDVGSQPAEEPDDTADPAETGDGGAEGEKPGQAKADDPREDEGEQGNDNREPKTGGTASQDNSSTTGDKTEAPAPPQQQSAFPADNTGSPKPPSRLESLARAREEQLQAAEQLRAKFQDVPAPNGTGQPAADERGDRGVPLQNENAGGGEREPEAQPPITEAPPGGTDGDGNDSGEPPAEPAADPPRPAEGQAPGGDRGKDAVGDGTGRGAAGEATAIEAVEAETIELPSAIDEELADGEAAASKPTRLEGQRDYVVDDPAVPSRTITDIDCIQDGVLWEEKSATNAGDIGRWVAKHIDKKFSSYLDARQYMADYEQAPIGFRFTSPGADPAFRSRVESAVERLRLTYPSEQILLEWS